MNTTFKLLQSDTLSTIGMKAMSQRDLFNVTKFGGKNYI